MSHRTLFYYDQESNLTCVRDADNGLTYYTYDLLNRMTSVKNPFGEVTYYDYTPEGQVKNRTLGNQTLTYYEHDDVGRVSKVDNRKSDLSVISTFEYEHDKVGNPTKITREDGSATYYQYDRIYQLTGETQVDDQGQVEYAFEYQYDKAHNRTVKVDNGTPTYYAYNEANELTHETTEGETTYYSYDRCGNTTAKQEPGGTTYYVYDTENLMTRIDFADGSHNYFAYDADSKRVSKQDSEGFTEFIYQGPDMLKLLLERDDEGETQAHYTMGGGLEAMRRNSTSSFYHYNHLGTTHELTDANENITDTYRHDAWGVPLARSGSTVNPHTYAGRERYHWMQHAALYHMGLRQYAPPRGGFLTLDPRARHEDVAWRVPPMAPSGLGVPGWVGAGGPSVGTDYLYAENHPCVLVDPEGGGLVIIIIIGGAVLALGIGVWWWFNRSGIAPLTDAQCGQIQKLIARLRECGLGRIADAAQIGGTKPLPGATAETVPGFLSIGKLTILDPAFFGDNKGENKLQTLIHEALHVICCFKGIKDDQSPQHQRIYEWQRKLQRYCDTGEGCGLPLNMRAVINDGAKPVYPA